MSFLFASLSFNGSQILFLLHFSNFFSFFSVHVMHGLIVSEMIWQFCKIATPTSKHRAVSSRATHSLSLHLFNAFKCLSIPFKSQGFYVARLGQTLSD